MDENSGPGIPDERGGDEITPSQLSTRHGVGRRVWNKIKLVYACVKPGLRAWRGAGIGVLVAAGLVYLATALWILLLAHENPIVYIIGLAVPLLALVGGGLSRILLRLLNLLPGLYIWALVSTTALVGFIYRGLGLPGILAVTAACVLVGSLIGASVWILAGGSGRDLTRVQWWITLSGFVAGVALAGFTTWWLIMDGRPGKQI